MSYFEEMGLVFPADQDQADFITEFITDPFRVYKRQLRREGAGKYEPPLTTGKPPPPPPGPLLHL